MPLAQRCNLSLFLATQYRDESNQSFAVDTFGLDIF